MGEPAVPPCAPSFCATHGTAQSAAPAGQSPAPPANVGAWDDRLNSEANREAYP